ncbi:glutamine amidotransferase [Actinomycetaceae bacterium WB03_NA08]|uniref:Lipid II isoglutaminyl synthase (glutamine-hydrolyzing) subunit GatD n=1 Tax=Scrofimicrobium canadense TaxID=2652290 RepID=A0A6N7W7M8_9ACTO|nr:glutamine amidotransferase [Scrofimicrobium canadense]MSS84256.1 glutamine amidotransferase [Scrofimicrobium canadense]
MSESTLQIGLIAPEVLGTYGDGGNACVLTQRAKRRGIDADIIEIPLFEAIPEYLDIYTLGGGEDTAQSLAAQHMQRHRGLIRAVTQGRPVLAICASLQVLGRKYTDAEGRTVEGLGLLDVETEPMGHRAIGELVSDPLIEGLSQPLTGFENHGGATTLGEDASPLGQVVVGCGNDGKSGLEGVVQGSVIATYMHGPVLARNPELADLLLSRALGCELEPLPMPSVDRLRSERLSIS